MHADVRRDAWQKEFFAKRPDVKIVGEQIAHWNKEEAMRYMEDWVQSNPKIDAIVSMNDDIAAGALDAVKSDPRFKNVLAYGVDGTAEPMLLIQSGRMTSTALQNAYDLAAKNISVAHELVTGKLAQDTDIDCPLVTKDNAAAFIEIHKVRRNQASRLVAGWDHTSSPAALMWKPRKRQRQGCLATARAQTGLVPQIDRLSPEQPRERPDRSEIHLRP